MITKKKKKKERRGGGRKRRRIKSGSLSSQKYAVPWVRIIKPSTPFNFTLNRIRHYQKHWWTSVDHGTKGTYFRNGVSSSPANKLSNKTQIPDTARTDRANELHKGDQKLQWHLHGPCTRRELEQVAIDYAFAAEFHSWIEPVFSSYCRWFTKIYERLSYNFYVCYFC